MSKQSVSSHLKGYKAFRSKSFMFFEPGFAFLENLAVLRMKVATSILGMDQKNGLAASDHGRFEATRWSEVLDAAQSQSSTGFQALARLCERYWPALYAFARHRGHSPEDAQDLVQGFFEHLIESRALGTVAPAKGRFRSFLLASFQNFIATEQRHARAEKRGGRADLISIDWKDAEDRLRI